MPISKSVLQMHWLPMTCSIFWHISKNKSKRTLRNPCPKPTRFPWWNLPVSWFSRNFLMKPQTHGKQQTTKNKFANPRVGEVTQGEVLPCHCFFFGFASPSKLTQQASILETVFLVGFARPGSVHFIPKNRARTQDQAAQPLFLCFFFTRGFTLENVLFESSYLVRRSRSNLFKVFIHRTFTAPDVSVDNFILDPKVWNLKKA